MNHRDSFLFLGDSVTDCERNRAIRQPNRPDALGTGWVNRVATRLLNDNHQARVWNRGYAGCRTEALLDQPDWQPVHGKKQQAVFREITLLIGINDIWHPFIEGEVHDISTSLAAFQSVVRTLMPLTNRLCVMEPFAIPGPAVSDAWWPLLDELTVGQREITTAQGADWLPTCEEIDQASKACPALWLYDGVHPGVLGHQWLAERWFRGR